MKFRCLIRMGGNEMVVESNIINDRLLERYAVEGSFYQLKLRDEMTNISCRNDLILLTKYINIKMELVKNNCLPSLQEGISKIGIHGNSRLHFSHPLPQGGNLCKNNE